MADERTSVDRFTSAPAQIIFQQGQGTGSAQNRFESDKANHRKMSDTESRVTYEAPVPYRAEQNERNRQNCAKHIEQVNDSDEIGNLPAAHVRFLMETQRYTTSMTTPDKLRIEPIRFFTEEELDEMEQTDPDRAYRIARAQAMAARETRAHRATQNLPPPDPDKVREAIEDVRHILMRDGGDIELVGIDESVVRVHMKGACAGCPHSVLDLQNVVEKIVMGVPGVTRVVNIF